MRGNGDNAPGSGSCSCDSPPNQSIPPSMNLFGSVTAQLLPRQTIWGSNRVPVLPRVASASVHYIELQSSYNGGKDDIVYKTRRTVRPGRCDIRCGNRGGLAACAQRAGAEPLRPAKNGAARGRVQIQRQCVELRPGKSDYLHQ